MNAYQHKQQYLQGISTWIQTSITKPLTSHTYENTTLQKRLKIYISNNCKTFTITKFMGAILQTCNKAIEIII